MYKGIIGIITALAGKFQLLFTVIYSDHSREKRYDKITVSISKQALKYKAADKQHPGNR